MGWWDERLINQASDVPSIILFHNFLGHSKLFILIFAKNFARNYEKKNTCNIRCLVDKLFIPATQQPSLLYGKLSDFKAKSILIGARKMLWYDVILENIFLFLFEVAEVKGQSMCKFDRIQKRKAV